MEEEACVWRSEDNWVSLFSPNVWFLGLELRSSGLATGAFAYWVSPLTGP